MLFLSKSLLSHRGLHSKLLWVALKLFAVSFSNIIVMKHHKMFKTFCLPGSASAHIGEAGSSRRRFYYQAFRQV